MENEKWQESEPRVARTARRTNLIAALVAALTAVGVEFLGLPEQVGHVAAVLASVL